MSKFNPVVKCRQCSLPVVWRQVDIKGQRSTLQCFNEDGSVHWDRCSQTRFEKIKATGVAFDHKISKGYFTHLKSSGVQYTYEASKAIKGVNYHPSGKCNNCVPPWETCESCPDKLEHAHA
jgi:hypothetical protein